MNQVKDSAWLQLYSPQYSKLRIPVCHTTSPKQEDTQAFFKAKKEVDVRQTISFGIAQKGTLLVSDALHGGGVWMPTVGTETVSLKPMEFNIVFPII